VERLVSESLFEQKWDRWSSRLLCVSDCPTTILRPCLIPRPIMISLTLFYTTLLPLALQLVLGIWYTHDTSNKSTCDYTVPTFFHSLLSQHLASSIAETVTEMLRVWERTDRIWAGTKLLGGMSAGFGLRVILPTRPWETTAIVLAGWGAGRIMGTNEHPLLK
jgi:hypothetical protein